MTCPGYHAVSGAIERLAGDTGRLGREMYSLVERLYPIPRSITGDGVRETLRILGETLAEGAAGGSLTIHEVASGTPALDWTVPKEWNVREAWVKDPSGRKVVDFADHNLHLLGYSVPIHRRMPLAELEEHLHSLPDQPDLVPYRTSYYAEAWGFCLPHRLREDLPEGEYEVKIDSELTDGSLTYGELAVPGETEDEVLLSCHVCHPSLANDNLSGLAVTAFLARELLALSGLRYTYRFVWVPGTIGAITWLARNRDAAGRVAHGLVAANLGDSGPFHYKRSQREDAPIDRAVAHVLRTAAGDGRDARIESWVPFGYDERQYNSPGFGLPVGLLSRTPWGRFPEYHTSADDLSLVAPGNLAGSLETYLRVMAILEGDLVYRNLSPHGEPQLGRRGLYSKLGGDSRSKGGDARERQLDLLWVLNQSDGERSLLDVAERAGRPFAAVRVAADLLCDAGLLAPLGEPGKERRP